jgi:hypothetical protein
MLLLQFCVSKNHGFPKGSDGPDAQAEDEHT